jgi:hypothetical protein
MAELWINELVQLLQEYPQADIDDMIALLYNDAEKIANLPASHRRAALRKLVEREGLGMQGGRNALSTEVGPRGVAAHQAAVASGRGRSPGGQASDMFRPLKTAPAVPAVVPRTGGPFRDLRGASPVPRNVPMTERLLTGPVGPAGKAGAAANRASRVASLRSAGSAAGKAAGSIPKGLAKGAAGVAAGGGLLAALGGPVGLGSGILAAVLIPEILGMIESSRDRNFQRTLADSQLLADQALIGMDAQQTEADRRAGLVEAARNREAMGKFSSDEDRRMKMAMLAGLMGRNIQPGPFSTPSPDNDQLDMLAARGAALGSTSKWGGYGLG